MKVTARYFAGLREVVGKASEVLEVPAGATARSVLLGVLGASRAERAAAVAFAVNREYVAGDVPLHEGDEVAFLPPVSGG